MLLLWSIPLGILIGYLRGGRLSRLAEVELRGAWLILLALFIQLLIFPIGGRAPWVPWGTQALHLLSYGLLLGFVFLNRREWGIVAMGVGMALNLLVIVANGGYMPTRPELLRAAGLIEAAEKLEQMGTYANNVLMGPKTRLNFLGDLFYVPAGVPLANVFSVGDAILALGLLIFLQAKMKA